MSEAVTRQLDRAAQLLTQGRLPDALEAYRRIVQAVPAELSARQKIAEILARQGDKAAAVAEYSEVVKRFAEQGDFFKATALSRVILTLDPNHKLAQQHLAELYASRPGAAAAGRAHHGAPLETGAIGLSYLSSPADVSNQPPEEIAFEDLLPEAEPPLPPRDALPHIPLFSALSTEEFLAVLSSAMDAKTIRAGQSIVTEGEPGSSMYAIAQGTVSVWREKQKVAVMHEGDFFGEMALLSGTPRMATVKADTDVVLLEFPRESMSPVIARHPGVRAGLELFHRDRMLANLIRANPLLQLLSLDERVALTGAFQPCTFKAGETVLEEGAAGLAVFLLLRGRCSVTQSNSAGEYPDLVEGDAFGEISVLTKLPVSATITAKEPVLALCVMADDFRKLVLTNTAVKKRVQELANERMTRTAKMALQADADQWV
jgi:cAMP-dependent protein kinase regulator